MNSHFLIDAGCLANLLASGRAEQILIISRPLHVFERAVKEPPSLNEYDAETQKRIGTKPVDLTPLLNKDLILPCLLRTDEERELAFGFACQLDDSEAEALALGKSKGWTVATDDGKTARIAKENDIETISTLQIILHWAKKNRMGRRELREIMDTMKHLASFVASPNLPGYDEWEKFGR